MGIFNLSQGQLYRKCTSLKCSVKLTVFLVSTGITVSNLKPPVGTTTVQSTQRVAAMVIIQRTGHDRKCDFEFTRGFCWCLLGTVSKKGTSYMC